MPFSKPCRIACVSLTREIVDDVRAYMETAPDATHFEMQYHVVSYKDAPRFARAHMSNGCEAVICHSGLGASVLRTVGAHMVRIERTDMDVIQHLQKAREQGKSIALPVHCDENRDIPTFERLLDIDIHPIPYTNVPELLSGVDAAYAQGVRVLAGGGVSVARMRELGGVGLVIPLNTHSIRTALQQAKSICHHKRLDLRYRQDLDNIFNRLRDGVVSINSLGELVCANERALQLLDVPPGQAAEVLPLHYAALGLADTLRHMESVTDSIAVIGARTCMVSTFPLRFSAGLTGAVAVFNDAAALRDMNRKLADARATRFAPEPQGHLAGRSPALQRLKAQIQRLASSEAPLFINGEPGTGKEMTALAIHNGGPRAEGPFVPVNCAVWSEEALEEELFGRECSHCEGARPGARQGLFELCAGGTVFIHEIQALSPALQWRLQRLLETGQIMRMGGCHCLPVDVRIISAAGTDLLEYTRSGQFRHDLYLRLTTLHLRMPPLRDRLEDIPALVEGVLSRHGKTLNIFSTDMLHALHAHPWKGNVRELLALAEGYCLQLDGLEPDPVLFREVFARHTPEGSQETAALEGSDHARPSGPTLKSLLQAHKVALARAALERHKGDRAATARSLGLSPASLWRILNDPQNR